MDGKATEQAMLSSVSSIDKPREAEASFDEVVRFIKDIFAGKPFEFKHKQLIFEKVLKHFGISYLELSRYYHEKIAKMEPIPELGFAFFKNFYIDERVRNGEWDRVLYYVLAILEDVSIDLSNTKKQESKAMLIDLLQEATNHLKTFTPSFEVYDRHREGLSKKQEATATVNENFSQMLEQLPPSALSMEGFDRIVDLFGYDAKNFLRAYANSVRELPRIDIETFRVQFENIKSWVTVPAQDMDTKTLLFEATTLFWDIYNDEHNEEKQRYKSELLDIIYNLAEKLK